MTIGDVYPGAMPTSALGMRSKVTAHIREGQEDANPVSEFCNG